MSHFSRPWWAHSLIISLYHSQASKSDYLSICLNLIMWYLSIVVFLRGKYMAKNSFFSSFQVVIELVGKDYSQALALSLRESGNKRRWITSGFTLLVFTCLHTIQTLTDEDLDPLWDFLWTGSVAWFAIENISIRSCLPYYTGGIILECGSSWDGTVKSLSGWLSGSAIWSNMALSSCIQRLRWM